MTVSPRLAALLDEHFLPANQERFGVPLAAVVQHKGEVIAERYGIDPGSGGQVGADTTLISWSMAKSLTHALVGMLVLDGKLQPDQPAPVREWVGDNRSAITLNHLLTMTSGLRFSEDYVDAETSDCIEMLFGKGSSDTAAYAAALPLDHEPGTVFNYSSGTTNIISRICKDALGGAENMAAFIQERLFDPLGMTNATVKTDEVGTFIGSSFVYATAREFAAFGQLYLQDGVWEGRRLLPEGWVDAARLPIEPEVEGDFGYGAQWWLWGDLNAFGAHGFEGQYTVVVPKHELVLVRLGKSPAEEHKTATTDWLRKLGDSITS